MSVKMLESKINTLQKAIKNYGFISQLNMTIEECAELIQAINKIKRAGLVCDDSFLRPNNETSVENALIFYNFCSEIADVKIMIQQLELMLPEEIGDIVEMAVERKIKRLENKMEEL